MYRVPSSTPPSTPDSRRSNRFSNSYGVSSAPSYTPAGVPPSSAFGSSQMFTGNGMSSFKKQPFEPSRAPQSSLFGGSQLFAGNGMSSFKPSLGPSGRAPSFGGRPSQQSSPGTPIGKLGSHTVFASSPPQEREEDQMDDDADGYTEEEEYEDDHGDEDEEAEEEESESGHDARGYRPSEGAPHPFGVKSPVFAPPVDSPRGLKRSRAGESIRSTHGPPVKITQQKYDVLGLAKGIAAAAPSPTLFESDDMILETETLLNDLAKAGAANDPSQLMTVASTTAHRLRNVWRSVFASHVSVNWKGIDSCQKENPLVKADVLASILTQLHHPTRTDSKRVVGAFGRSSQLSLPAQDSLSPQAAPMPRILLDWLNDYHDPGAAEMADVKRYTRGYSAHSGFWDVVLVAVLRGRFSDALTLLKGADFRVADSAVADGEEEPGYRGLQLKHTEQVVNRAIQILGSCPAVQSDDWDIAGGDWILFRHRVAQALADLREFAEGENQDRYDEPAPFQAENFGISGNSSLLGLSTASRKVESSVPFTIYENLCALYGQLLGNPDELLASSFDWIEAVMVLTIWWDGEEDDIPRGSLVVSRRSLTRAHRTRPVDLTPVLAYRQRLASSFARVVNAEDTEGSQLRVNTLNPVEVGLACVFEDSLEGVFNIFRTCSIVVTAAIVELASAANWLGDATSPSKGLMRGFDQSDLMVLSFGQEESSTVKKDDVLFKYAEMLFEQDMLHGKDDRPDKEGWELSVKVLGRLDNVENAVSHTRDLLNRLPLESVQRVDKVLELCNSLGFSDIANHLAEKYADSLTESTRDYGNALLYYARAHKPKKIKEVLDILISYCLVQSIAYPPFSELDEQLKKFVESPRLTLNELARIDFDAAKLLVTYLSGYATLRKFYDLRDAETNSGSRKKLAKRRRLLEAASALIAVIESASDSIRGGLFDLGVDVVVQVDGLLTLLGEALVFLNQPEPLLTLSQITTLLRAIEDLQTVTPRVYSQCDECFRSALASAHGSETASPRAILRKGLTKSISNITTTSSQFSLIGDSEILGSRTSGGLTENGGSGVLVGNNVRRGWDWRQGWEVNTTSEEMLRVLRLRLAEEVAKAWANGME